MPVRVQSLYGRECAALQQAIGRWIGKSAYSVIEWRRVLGALVVAGRNDVFAIAM